MITLVQSRLIPGKSDKADFASTTTPTSKLGQELKSGKSEQY